MRSINFLRTYLLTSASTTIHCFLSPPCVVRWTADAKSRLIIRWRVITINIIITSLVMSINDTRCYSATITDDGPAVLLLFPIINISTSMTVR